MITPPRYAGFLKLVFALALGGALPYMSVAAKDVKSAELEARFWRCDYETTKGLLDLGSAQVCSEATEALRMTRFNGDFNAMLAWWQSNKVEEHRALQSSANTSEPKMTLENRVRGMSDADLQRLYLRCARASEQRRLDSDEIIACSVGQDALLARVFGGRFDALLAWSEEQLASSIEVAQSEATGRSTPLE